MTRDPLSAVPVVPDGVIVTPTATGLLLERPASRSGRLGRFVERKFGVARRRSFELDRAGAEFFRAIDGTRTLAELERKLRESHDMTPDQGREAVTAFTKLLLERGLILLRLDA